MPDSNAILHEIEHDLLNGKPLADLLRECLLLGAHTGSQRLRSWARQELDGYGPDDALPSYRCITAAIAVDGMVAGGMVTGQNLPESALPPQAREAGIGHQVDMRYSVGELEGMLEHQSSPLRLSLPSADIIGYQMDQYSGNSFQHITRIYWTIPPAAIAGILDHIRTALTELVAELVTDSGGAWRLPTARSVDHALHVAVTGDGANVSIAHGDGATSTADRDVSSAEDVDPAWWTFGRKVSAIVVSLFVVVGAIAAVVAVW